MSEQERSALLRKVANGIVRRFDEFLAAEVRDTGKPPVSRPISTFRVAAARISTSLPIRS